MPVIDYFKPENGQSTNEKLFGLCDDCNQQPAFIDTVNRDNWLGEIRNEQTIEVVFYPIDHCVKVFREDGATAQCCEGVLRYSDPQNIIFVELKNRKCKPDYWLKEAIGQIKETLAYFFKYNDRKEFAKVRAWIANKQLTNQNYWQQIKQFRADTGLVLYIQKSLSLPQ